MKFAEFKKWCSTFAESIKNHELKVLTAEVVKTPIGISALAKVVPEHYTSSTRAARVLKKFGKRKAAAFLEQKLPTGKSIRSGDLGEILCASYVSELTKYNLCINKLRWKDHREMAMRGEDLIAVYVEKSNGQVQFLKAESKSNLSLANATISEARSALRKNNGRPSPHSLSFLADRLHEIGDSKTGDLLDDAQLAKGIKLSQMRHMIFTFSGNDPKKLLRDHVVAYQGSVPQMIIGLHVEKHQKFIKSVFETVIINATKT